MIKLGLNLFKKRFEVRILFGSNLPLKLVRDLPGSPQQDDVLITRERGEFTPLSMYFRIKETLTPDPLIEGELEKMIQVSHGL